MEFKWAEDLLQKKINEKIVENLMDSMYKSPVVEKIMGYKAIERNLIESLSAYECKYGFTPNKIIMGYNVYQYFHEQFCNEYTRLNCKTTSEFCGVPIEVDYENPNRLEIGHMIKLA